ncbi:hypothetical protein ACH46N_02500 [Streptomyces pristinaespiralis]|uniref:Uncharacterized protein n=2 Tax=Streptomyces pristinaespiralis TaxID=38300 RepID=B5HHB0_STRE2|nr:hypothetical protein [Streptomyces pristinaespiralis]ALC19560.1 collagen triple helix repeat protein [Streptomyces pristinaespiralis]EDY66221.1 conserved hypothetical protein [Streptomyces pristinaespiralis ATCC 25486]
MVQVQGTGQNEAGVLGVSESEDGVLGFGKVSGKAGVAGANDHGGNGVFGRGTSGVVGHGQAGNGVIGASETEDGVLGIGKVAAKAGVAGVNDNGGNGVLGRGHNGLFGDGRGAGGSGVVGVSETGDGVLGIGKDAAKAGVAGVNDNGGNGLFGRGHNGVVGQAMSGGKAGFFAGDVEVTGDLILTGGDVAEQFAVADAAPDVDEVGPGTVVVLDDDGALAPCVRQYDSRVAGVVSGAGDRVPALVLDRGGEPAEDMERRDIAVVGKVWCRSDASDRGIRVGDLLTTSSTAGHAMAAVDRDAAFGAVLGKALTPLSSGTGLVLALVSLA